MGRLCYPTTAPPQCCPGRPQGCHGARRVWHVFLQSRYKFYYMLARSRYKVYRSREFIPGYKVGGEYWCSVGVQIVSEPEICQGLLSLNCVQMCVSGCKNHYKLVLGAEVKAKTVTNNLPILSVLGFRTIIFLNPGL